MLKCINRKLSALIECNKNIIKLCKNVLDESKVLKNCNLKFKKILESSKFKFKTSMRYLEDWILKYILFHTRSPSGYRFIFNNNILPLLCPISKIFIID